METQYIGARYVPKFYENSQNPSSMEWENNKGYEPLTVVTWGDDTYTSKKVVPSIVGNPASNPTYWAKTGAYNAAIEALARTVSQIGEEVEDVKSETVNIGSGMEFYFNAIFNVQQTTYFAAINNNTIYTSLQGAAYDSKRDRIALMLIHGTDGNMIVVLDRNDLTSVIARKEYTNAQMGHGNMMCYNPTLDKYLTCPDNEDGNKINVVNPITLEIEAVYTPTPATTETSYRTTAITYDYDNDLMYVACEMGFYKISNTFENLGFMPFNFKDAYKGGSYESAYFNGFCYYKGKLYYTIQYTFDECRINWLMGVNTEDVSVYSSCKLPMYQRDTEYEGSAVIDGVINLFSQKRLFTITKAVLQNELIDDFYKPSFDLRPLKENEDLNDLVAYGKYFSPSTEVSATLLHAPMPIGSFMLEVFGDGNTTEQRMTYSAYNWFVIFHRRFDVSSWSWSGWVEDHDVHILPKQSYNTQRRLFTGIIGASGTLAFDIPDLQILTTTVHPISGVECEFNLNIYTIGGRYETAGGVYDITDENATLNSISNEKHAVHVTIILPETPAHLGTPCTVLGNLIIKHNVD